MSNNIIERRMASIVGGAGDRNERKGMSAEQRSHHHYYGPVSIFNGEVRITHVSFLGASAPARVARRELLQEILSTVNAKGMTDWFGDYLRDEFGATGLMDLTDDQVQIARMAVIAREGER